VICGIAGLVVFAIAALGLKELSPQLRDQLMVSMQDRALIEAKAKGINVEESLKNPWGQLVKPDILISATGISIFLLVYYTAVAFGTIFFVTVFGQSLNNANGIGNWNWGADVVAVIAFGIISDKLRVRKPFMIVGGLAAAVMLLFYIGITGNAAHTGYYSIVTVVALLSFFLGVAYVPWMASFTETVEDHNPALTATGLAIWGWIIRVVVTVAYLLLPIVVHSVTPLVGDFPKLEAKYPALATPAPILKELGANNLAHLGDAIKATQQELTALHRPASQTDALGALTSLKSMTPADQKTLANVGSAAANAPSEWQHWYWICFGGTIFFLATVPLMRGRWSPKKAREDEAAHEAMVQAEMSKMGITA
jgi:hypothetical protein